jgi:dinuclear metal center YbgI/SA1388 family protein
MKKPLRVREIFDFLCGWAPPSLAEEWDSVGLQVGSFEDEVRGVLVSLDVTEPALWEAVEHEANLLVTHHPLFFKPISELTDRTPVMRKIRLAVETGVNVLSFHTNLDAAGEGLNDQLAKRLRLGALKPLVPSRDPRLPKAGLGRLGTTRPTKLAPFLRQVAEALDLGKFRYVGDLKHPIRRVAVMTGSGGGFYHEAKAAGADVLVTGDVKYHHALEAVETGIAIVDIGHWAGEIGMVPLVAQKLRRWLRRRAVRVPVHETQTSEDPFRFYE